MNIMYQQVINEKSSMKVDLTVAENKAKKKEEKVEALERALVVGREKN
jgi:hypothetical protein